MQFYRQPVKFVSLGTQLLTLLIISAVCAERRVVEIPDFARNSLALKAYKLQSVALANRSANHDAVKMKATALIYDLPHHVEPNDIECESASVTIQRIDCVDQFRNYRNLGHGYALRIYLHSEKEWPETIALKLKGQRIVGRLTDPSDRYVHLYVSDWKHEKPRRILPTADAKIVWIVKRTGSDYLHPVNFPGLLWESWFRSVGSMWAYAAAVETDLVDDQSLSRFLKNAHAKAISANVYLCP